MHIRAFLQHLRALSRWRMCRGMDYVIQAWRGVPTCVVTDRLHTRPSICPIGLVRIPMFIFQGDRRTLRISAHPLPRPYQLREINGWPNKKDSSAWHCRFSYINDPTRHVRTKLLRPCTQSSLVEPLKMSVIKSSYESRVAAVAGTLIIRVLIRDDGVAVAYIKR